MKKLTLAAATILIALCTQGFAVETVVEGLTPVGDVWPTSHAVPTANADLSTTFTLPTNCEAVIVYTDLTPGLLTGVTLVPASAASDNPTSTSYYRATESSQTLTLAKTVLRFPREQFGAQKYAGFWVQGVGANTDSLFRAQYKREVRP